MRIRKIAAAAALAVMSFAAGRAGAELAAQHSLSTAWVDAQAQQAVHAAERIGDRFRADHAPVPQRCVTPLGSLPSGDAARFRGETWVHVTGYGS